MLHTNSHLLLFTFRDNFGAFSKGFSGFSRGFSAHGESDQLQEVPPAQGVDGQAGVLAAGHAGSLAFLKAAS